MPNKPADHLTILREPDGAGEREQDAGATGGRRRRRVWRTVAAIAAALVLVVGIGGAALAWWAVRDVDLSTVTDEEGGLSVVLQTADGETLVTPGEFNGPYATLDQMPDVLIQAVLTAEDRRFYDHGGLDYRGIVRAAFTNAMAGEVVQGGSTITQQLVKILYLDRDRTYSRKIREAVLANMVEMRLTKDQILERYLNTVYFGEGATGVAAAARIYFDKDVSQLTLSESAMLASIIRAPSVINPVNDLEAAQARANAIIRTMQAEGLIDEQASIDAQVASAQFRPHPAETGHGSWFADWVTGEARKVAGPFRGTVTVRTSLDPRLQDMAQKAVDGVLAGAGPKADNLQAALVAMDPQGHVVAMVGGRDYGESEYNRAVQAMRQPGSTFKLFVYYAALKAGMSPDDVIEDKPVDIDGYSPENYSGEYAGQVTLAEAFARSLNAATVRLAETIGVDKVAAAARELGIEADLTETPSLSLGTSEVSLLDLTEAYAAVRAGKAPITGSGVTGFSMGDEGEFFSVPSPAAGESDIGQYRDTLVSMLRNVVENGTGKKARLDGFAAGKTGTTQNWRDAWFVGFNEPLVAGVWVGHDDGSPMDEVTGGSLPAEIWRSFMQGAASGQPVPAEIEKRPAPEPQDTPMASAAPEPQQVQQQEPVSNTEPRDGSVVNLELVGDADAVPADEGGQQRVQQEPAQAAPVASTVENTSLSNEAAALGASGQSTASVTEAVTQQVRQCNVSACQKFYNSFRASDCTFQPYGGGPRKFCER